MREIIASRFETPESCPLTRSIRRRKWFVQPIDGVLRVPYHVLPETADDPGPDDQNRGPIVTLADGPHDFVVRWTQRIDAPVMEPQGHFDSKILYAQGALAGTHHPTWSIIVVWRSQTTTSPGRLSLHSNANGYSDITPPLMIELPSEYGREHTFALGVRLNAPGERDGRIVFEIDGVVPEMRQGRLIRGVRALRDLREGSEIREDISPLWRCQWGMQINRRVTPDWTGEILQDRWISNVRIEAA